MAEGFRDAKGRFRPTKTGTGHSDRFKLLSETSGKTGMKHGEDFVSHEGKIVTPAEKQKAIELKEKKEKK